MKQYTNVINGEFEHITSLPEELLEDIRAQMWRLRKPASEWRRRQALYNLYFDERDWLGKTGMCPKAREMCGKTNFLRYPVWFGPDGETSEDLETKEGAGNEVPLGTKDGDRN